MTRASDLLLGRNGSHRYNITPAPPHPPERLKKDGTPYKVQPRRPAPKFDTVGVTTIANMGSKDGLVWGAAKETALLAVHGRAEWSHLGPEAAVNKLRTHFRHVWDLKAETGNIVHAIALEWAHQRDADLEWLLTFDEDGVERTWSRDERTEVLRRVDGCLSALELFYLEQRPRWRVVEQTLINPGASWKFGDEYRVDPRTATAGCLDADGELAEHGEVLLDFKTGQRYLEATILQVCGGYAGMKLIGHHDEEGHLLGVEPYQAPKKRAVVFLRDDGEYEFLELPGGKAPQHEFMRLRRHHNWRAEMRAWERSHPDPFGDLETPLDAGEIDTEVLESPAPAVEVAA